MPMINIALPAIFGDMRPSPDLSIVSYSFICGNKLMNQLYHLFITTGVSQGQFSSLIATVTEGNTFTCVYRFLYSNAIYHTEQQKSLKSYSKNAIGVKKVSKKKGHFAHIGNEIKICSQNKCHHHLSNVCENSFRMFHSNWVISDYHSFVWQFEFPWLNLTNCLNK